METDEAAVAEPDAGGETAPDNGGDVSALMERFDGFNASVMEKLGSLEGRLPEPAQESDEDYTYEEPQDFTDEDFDDDGELTEDAQRRALDRIVDARIAERLTPLQEQREADRRESEADALEDQYPELGDAKKAAPVIQATQQAAQQVAAKAGDAKLAGMLAREPAFLELVYLAGLAREHAGRQEPAGDERVGLERSGATSASAVEDDAADRIVNSGPKRSFWD